MVDQSSNTAERLARIVKADDSRVTGMLEGASCAFGVFDGVHLGHRFIIDCAREDARNLGCQCTILTFDVDPDELFRPGKLKKILSNEERIDMLAHTGVDAVVVLPFTREFASQEPVAFLEAMFGSYPPAAVHVGCDFRFGARAKGTLSTMEEWGSAHGIKIVGHELLELDDAPITSTRIRALMESGNVAEAEKLLGRPLAR